MKNKLIYLILILASACQSPKVYLVRHAEKSTQPANDPHLTPDGEQRAADLAQIFGHQKIRAIYTTKYNRTLETAKPLSLKTGVAIQFYSPDTAAKIVAGAQQNTLIVGHSNTLLPLLKSLGLNPTFQEIKDNDYDNLFIVYKKKGVLKLKEKTYGKPTAAGEVSMK